MLCRPDDDFDDHRQQVDAFFREPVDAFRAVLRVTDLLDDTVLRQLLQTAREGVGGDPFAGALEFAVVAPSVHRDVTDDEERPSVAEEIQAEGDGTLGAAFHGDRSLDKVLAFCK